MQITVPDVSVEQAKSAQRAVLAAAYTADSGKDLESASLAYQIMTAVVEAASK